MNPEQLFVVALMGLLVGLAVGFFISVRRSK
jgi:uncharacterized protein YneF (UPF0154 family)